LALLRRRPRRHTNIRLLDDDSNTMTTLKGLTLDEHSEGSVGRLGGVLDPRRLAPTRPDRCERRHHSSSWSYLICSCETTKRSKLCALKLSRCVLARCACACGLFCCMNACTFGINDAAHGARAAAF
jgi:hypothetical protein